MSRAKAREVAMKQLYALEMGGECSYLAALQARFDEDDLSRTPTKTDELFAAQLVQGVLDHVNSIDPYIIEQSRGWSLERIASIERILLRMAIFEMKFSSDEVPVSAIINEAVTLAKKYGSNDRAGAYVNGVLGGVTRRTGDPLPPLDPSAIEDEAISEIEEMISEETVDLLQTADSVTDASEKTQTECALSTQEHPLESDNGQQEEEELS